jgi:hypothetical protein
MFVYISIVKIIVDCIDQKYFLLVQNTWMQLVFKSCIVAFAWLNAFSLHQIPLKALTNNSNELKHLITTTLVNTFWIDQIGLCDFCEDFNGACLSHILAQMHILLCTLTIKTHIEN